jgi:hypothetical protein
MNSVTSFAKILDLINVFLSSLPFSFSLSLSSICNDLMNRILLLKTESEDEWHSVLILLATEINLCTLTDAIGN